ncbi:hypothetical protein BGZ73_001096, partial [Actinomortierella ambigua]
MPAVQFRRYFIDSTADLKIRLPQSSVHHSSICISEVQLFGHPTNSRVIAGMISAENYQRQDRQPNQLEYRLTSDLAGDPTICCRRFSSGSLTATS